LGSVGSTADPDVQLEDLWHIFEIYGNMRELNLWNISGFMV
jgi:hypothetical protein